jgi:hypothetical protein
MLKTAGFIAGGLPAPEVYPFHQKNTGTGPVLGKPARGRLRA